MSNLDKLKINWQDYKTSSMEKSKLELKEKRTSCKKWIILNINFRRKLTKRGLINRWSWVHSRTIAVNNLRCNISTLKNFKRKLWLNSWDLESIWKLKWMKDSTNRTKLLIVCHRASRHSKTQCKLWEKQSVEVLNNIYSLTI